MADWCMLLSTMCQITSTTSRSHVDHIWPLIMVVMICMHLAQHLTQSLLVSVQRMMLVRHGLFLNSRLKERSDKKKC